MFYIFSFSILLVIFSSCQTGGETRKYIVGETRWAFGEFSFLNLNGDTIRKLDANEYTLSFSDTFERFAVFGIHGKPGWYAVDIREKILFEVCNVSGGEISPDILIEDKIRIVDDAGKIGFANAKGKIIIKPQFEIVTHFSNGYAIIAEDCEKVSWETDDHDVGEGEEEEEGHGGCEHYSIECKKYGYINTKGAIYKLGDFTFDEIQKEINWKSYERY